MGCKWGVNCMKKGSVLLAVLIVLIIIVSILAKLQFLLGIRLKGYP